MWSQPSASIVAAVVSGSRQYSRIMAGERQTISPTCPSRRGAGRRDDPQLDVGRGAADGGGDDVVGVADQRAGGDAGLGARVAA